VDRRFLNAHIDPAPFRILGRTLYPWCLKYRVRLHALDSPLVTGARGVTPSDLIFACQVCAEEPLGGLGFMDKMRVIYLNENFPHFERLLKAFSDYVLIHDWPKFWEQTNKKSGGSKGPPWPLSIVANLVANGVPYKQAWEMPECQAIWLNAAFAMRKGVDVAIMCPEEEAFIESELKREAEEAAAAKAVANPAG
jgi:hypothetical protein